MWMNITNEYFKPTSVWQVRLEKEASIIHALYKKSTLNSKPKISWQ